MVNIKEKSFSFINLLKALAIHRANALKHSNNIQNHTNFGIQPCLQIHYLKNNTLILMSYIRRWCAREDSNSWPLDSKSSALSSWATSSRPRHKYISLLWVQLINCCVKCVSIYILTQFNSLILFPLTQKNLTPSFFAEE